MSLHQDIKNQMVFPLFYGAASHTLAFYLKIDTTRAEKIYNEFWHMFPGVRIWQNRLIEYYLEDNYIESLTGFRMRAPLSKNQVLNYQIQSSASDLVVDAMNRLSEYAYDTNRWQFQARLNIHDDLSFCLPEETLEEDINVILSNMLKYDFDFVNVPIGVSAAVGPNLADTVEIGSFFSNKWDFGDVSLN